MKIVLYTKDPRLRASPRHGGARRFEVFFSHSNRRGGVASGAAAFIAILKEGHLFWISRYIRFS
jgi:hypothetical protein